jgi:tRNA pseudouridine38-40 synthase
MEKYMRNIKMILEYDGGKYKGWQRQRPSDITIQGKLEDVLSRMAEEKIEIIGSGRTDAGVHAMNQIANFWTNSGMSLDTMVEYCYRYLPEDIVVKSAEEVPELFHSRYNAVNKTYLYRICYRKHHDVFDRKYSYHIEKQPNIDEMITAAGILCGEHDFKSFTSLKTKKKSTVRKIYSIDITKNLGYIDISIIGNGFLQSMVRIIVGTLLEVGYGNIKANEIKEILKKKDRSQAGPPAPAHGLFLKEVKY